MIESKPKILRTIGLVLLLIMCMVWLRLFEDWIGEDFASYGILPRTLEGLKGILFSPLLHGSWTHLIHNLLPFFISVSALFLFYPKSSRWVFIGVYFMTGLLVWVFARQSYHLGASGLNYGFLSFLFFMGLFRKDHRSLALSFLVIFLYSGLLAGLFPGDPRISWESHFFGALSGLVFAVIFRKTDPIPKILEDELDREEIEAIEQSDLNQEGQLWS